jgi:hypothetical protein
MAELDVIHFVCVFAVYSLQTYGRVRWTGEGYDGIFQLGGKHDGKLCISHILKEKQIDADFLHIFF